MRLIVTRPAAQATLWVKALRAAGADAVALPLIRIAAMDDVAPLREAWSEIGRLSLVMFVSANAVSHFFDARPAAVSWPTRVIAGSTGPGTSAALRSRGIGEALVEPDPAGGVFESEALWQQLSSHDWQGRRALVVRGEGGREWLAERLRERGAEVGFVAAYRRLPPDWTLAERALLGESLQDPARHVWHFSSSQAISHLRALAPEADWARSRALVSHTRIADAARGAGFGTVTTVPPDVASVASAIQGPSIQSAPL